MVQGALGAAGVRRVGYGLEVGRSVRTAGGAGAYCVATRTACSELAAVSGYFRSVRREAQRCSNRSWTGSGYMLTLLREYGWPVHDSCTTEQPSSRVYGTPGQHSAPLCPQPLKDPQMMRMNLRHTADFAVSATRASDLCGLSCSPFCIMSLSDVSGTHDKRQSCRYVVNTHGKMELHVIGVGLLMAVNSVIFDNVLIHHIICKSYENK